MSKKITIEEVKKTAKLARIKLTEKEEKAFTEDLGNVLEFFSDIEEVESGNVEKFDHYQLSNNQLRTDEVLRNPEELNKGIKDNFPKQKNGYLEVKTVLKK